MNRIIVSRHPATVEFIAQQLDGEVVERVGKGVGGLFVKVRATPDTDPDNRYDHHLIRVAASAAPEDVRGKIVYGNLPLHMAALAKEVWAVEFTGVPPRGQEYTLADMHAAGARLTPYIVLGRERVASLREAAKHSL